MMDPNNSHVLLVPFPVQSNKLQQELLLEDSSLYSVSQEKFKDSSIMTNIRRISKEDVKILVPSVQDTDKKMAFDDNILSSPFKLMSSFMKRFSPLKFSWKAHLPAATLSRCSNSTRQGNNSVLANHFPVNELEEFADNFSCELKKTYSPSTKLVEDNTSDKLVVLGIDISHFSRRSRFIICACCVYSFSLLYGFLQELLSVQILNRKLGLFLAMCQMTTTTTWSYMFRRFDICNKRSTNQTFKETSNLKPTTDSHLTLSDVTKTFSCENGGDTKGISIHMYLGLSILRAVDIGMANLSMQFMNYPAKTLMKSSRVIFTMLFGILILRRKYPMHDYIVAALAVTGLALFLHADSTSSAIFQSMGIVMLATSLMCDGAIVNMSESLMQKHNVGHNEYLFRLSSVATLAISVAAAYKGDIREGISFLSMPGTYEEMERGIGAQSIWTVSKKISVLLFFSSIGFFGSSCATCITREYGALTMSITSTARKATTLFMSFVIFKNVCTREHALGMLIFTFSLILKSLGKSGEVRKTTTQGEHYSFANQREF